MVRGRGKVVPSSKDATSVKGSATQISRQRGGPFYICFCRAVAYHRILQSVVVVFRGTFVAVVRKPRHLVYYAAEREAWDW